MLEDSLANLKKITGASILILSILGGSAIGVVSNELPCDSPFVKNAWRSVIVIIYFSIPSIIENYNLYSKTNYRKVFAPKAYFNLILTTMCAVVWSSGLLYASSRTI